MLRFRTEVALEVSDRLAPVRKKLDLLVGLHPLGPEELDEATLGLFVTGLHKGKAFARGFGLVIVTSEGQDALAHDHLEPAWFLSGLQVPPSMTTVSGPSGIGKWPRRGDSPR
jgi:hypothetical protein